jgi:hypothetical protein
MRRLVCLVGCAVFAGSLGHVPGAAAAPVALVDAPRAVGVAVAGGEVLVASAKQRSGVLLRAVPATGGAARTVLSVPRPRGARLVAEVRLSSSAELTALLASFIGASGVPSEWRVYAGPPAGPLELVHRVRFRRGERPWMPIDVDVHGDRLAMQELRYPGTLFRTTVLAGGEFQGRVSQGRFGTPTVVAGDDLAYVDLGPRADGPAFMRIVDWRTGDERSSLRLRRFSGELDFRPLDLAVGGRVVAALDGRLLAGAPGEPMRRVPGTARANLTAPRMAGDLFAALTRSPRGMRPVVVDPRAGALRALGPLSTALPDVAASEETVAWLANGCVLAASVDDTGPAGVPPAGPCPRSEVVLGEGENRLRGRVLRVRVSCVAAPASGCRGEVLLGRGGGWAGRGRFRVPAGEREPVRVRLSRRGLSQVRRHHRRFGHAFLHLAARVENGRLSRGAGAGSVLIQRLG